METAHNLNFVDVYEMNNIIGKYTYTRRELHCLNVNKKRSIERSFRILNVILFKMRQINPIDLIVYGLFK